MTTAQQLSAAKNARLALAAATADRKNAALRAMAASILTHKDEILAANEKDIEAARETVSAVMLDRLRLNGQRLAAMSDGILQVAALPDPCGRVLNTVVRPNGLRIEKISCPMGVIAIIFESRPNVTSDAAALAVKAGSACILRAGKEAHRSAEAITDCLREGLVQAGLPADAVQLIEDVTRASAQELMRARGYVDLLIPRGGRNLIRACVDEATVPVLETGTGICHVYVDGKADFDKALDILENAKCSRPSVCNAAECCLVDRRIAADFLPLLEKRLVRDRSDTPVELHLDEAARRIISGVAAEASDFDTEYLDYKLSVAVVDGVDAAIAHIAQHSTGHSEAIVTEDAEAAARFTASVDSAAVYVNASTRFTDGGEFGLGCEMGISTQKLHARGPLGLQELCTFKYVCTGNGQIR